MNICIDCRGLNRSLGAGLYTYSFELIHRLPVVYPSAKYDFVLDGGELTGIVPGHKNARFCPLPLSTDLQPPPLNELLVRRRAEIFHSTSGFGLPRRKACSTVITVHGLAPLTVGADMDEDTRSSFSREIPAALEQADRIVAVSEFVRAELMSYYPELDLGEKTIVNYPGCSDIFQPISKERCLAVLHDRFSLWGDYLLYAGSLHRRKNLDILLSWFKTLLDDYPDLHLIFAGTPDSGQKSHLQFLMRLAEKLGISDSVIFLGAVSYTDMPWLYGGAVCLLNLSDYEGFPTSCVEAAACGTPVICFDNSSFREVIGDSGPLVRMDDLRSLRILVTQLLGSTDFRKACTEKRLQKCTALTWEAHIRKLVGMYEDILYGR